MAKGVLEQVMEDALQPGALAHDGQSLRRAGREDELDGGAAKLKSRRERVQHALRFGHDIGRLGPAAGEGFERRNFRAKSIEHVGDEAGLLSRGLLAEEEEFFSCRTQFLALEEIEGAGDSVQRSV